jgi:uncharacterized protein (TIGR01777 family)
VAAKRVVLTGGSGLIGRPLAAALIAGGYEVAVLSRDPRGVSGMPPGVLVEHWDGSTAEGWGALVDGALAVVNLAGENIGSGRWSAAKKRRLRDSRLNAGAAVVQAITAARSKPAVLVQSSAVGYYGNRGDEVLSEASAPGKGFLPETCLAWEASTAAVEALGVRRVVARSGVVLSRDGGAFPKLVLPFRLLGAGRWATGSSGCPGSTLRTRSRR